MTSFGYRLNPRYAIKECLSCGALYPGDFCCLKGNVEDKILVPKLPKNCARCGHPVDGPYCQGCALLRKKLEEDLVLLLAWDRVFEIKDAFENKQYKPKDMQELFRKLFNNVQNIHEELAEYINTLGWNRRAFYNNGDDDDVDYTIAITPVLSTEEPYNSLSIPDTMCDVHLVNNPTPLEAKDHFEIVINSNNDISSSDDDYLYNENIEYVEASPHDFELVSLEVAKIVISKDKEIEDDNLHEKFTTTHSDISLSEYDLFTFDRSNNQFPPTDRSDFTHEEFADELAHIISPPEYDCF
nr:hypothetical protein [Tanacetum cinerariifolium]